MLTEIELARNIKSVTNRTGAAAIKAIEGSA